MLRETCKYIARSQHLQIYCTGPANILHKACKYDARNMLHGACKYMCINWLRYMRGPTGCFTIQNKAMNYGGLAVWYIQCTLLFFFGLGCAQAHITCMGNAEVNREQLECNANASTCVRGAHLLKHIEEKHELRIRRGTQAL